jgi:hypothetical protein
LVLRISRSDIHISVLLRLFVYEVIVGLQKRQFTQTKGEETKLKTLREILQTHANKPKVTTRKRSYLKDSEGDDGGLSSEFAYISRFDYDNQRVIEQLKKDILAVSKWADVAVSVIAIPED